MPLDVVVMIGSGLISLSIIFYGNKIAKGVEEIRKDLNDYKIHMEHRLSIVEVRQDEAINRNHS